MDDTPICTSSTNFCHKIGDTHLCRMSLDFTATMQDLLNPLNIYVSTVKVKQPIKNRAWRWKEHIYGKPRTNQRKKKTLNLSLSSQVADLLKPPSQIISTIYHSRQLQFFNYHILLITSPQRDSSEFKRQELLPHPKWDIFLECKWFIWVNKNVNVWYLAPACNDRWFFWIDRRLLRGEENVGAAKGPWGAPTVFHLIRFITSQNHMWFT